MVVLLILLLMPLAALLMLRTAPMQTYLAHRAADFLSKELKTEVRVGNFTVNWFFEIVLSDIKIADKYNQTILQAEKIRADLKGIDTKNRVFSLNAVALTKADINLIYYEADSNLNLQFIIDHFSSASVDTTSSKPWSIVCTNLRLRDNHFVYRDERYMEPGIGIDFSDMDFSKINLELNDIAIQGDSIIAGISQLACNEKSGLALSDFSTSAVVCPRGISADNLQFTTSNSRISMDLKFEYANWNAYNYFLDSVLVVADIRPSQLDMQDIVYFAPDIVGMKEVFDLSGKVRGTVSSFNARDFKLQFADTQFEGDIIMNGLPNWDETFVNLKIDKLTTRVGDIQAFTIPGEPGQNTIDIPAEIERLGNISVNGRFTGFYNDFVSKATFVTDAGDITTDILLTTDKKTHTSEYNGKILVESFDAGKVLNVKQLGSLDLYAAVKGKNFSPDKADLTMKGELTNLEYEGNTIGLINFDGEYKRKRFTGGVYINDELLGLDFFGSADFSDTLPAFDFQAEIMHADLAKLELFAADSICFLNTTTDFRFKGNSIDNLLGTLDFRNTSFELDGKELKMNYLTLKTEIVENGEKHMEVNSDFADATFTGQYTFADLADYMTMVFTEFLPSLSSNNSKNKRVEQGRFDYTITLNNTDSLFYMFAPWLKITPNTLISGTFDPKTGLVNVSGKSQMIVVSGFALHDWTLNGASDKHSLHVEMNCKEVNMSESLKPDTSLKRIEQFKILAVAANDSVKFNIGWDDDETPDHYKGNIAGALSFRQNPTLALRIDDAMIVINDTVWNSIPGNLSVFDTSSYQIHNFGFTNNQRHIILDGVISNDPLSELILDVQGFNLSHTDILTTELGFDLDGYLDARVKVSDLLSIPRIAADLNIKSFGVNHEFLGDAALTSEWDNENSLLAIDMRVIHVGNVGTHFPIKVKGNIYPEREHENFALNINVDNLKVRTIEPFLEGIFSRLRGYASGAMTLTGDFANPEIKGKVNLMRTELLVDYLRTSYSFTGDFNFDKDKMWFKDIVLMDSTFGKGVVSGTINHKAFSDWALDINLTADNLLALSTVYSPVEMYYGLAKATGTMTLNGPIDNLVLKANVRSEKGTSVYIPISFSRSISENDFIRYKTHNDDIERAHTLKDDESSVLSLQLGLEVTRNADLGIILPYQMGTIDVRGDGLINMGIDTRGDYSMYGQYIMDNGNFLFNFQNILKKNFIISKGGAITFNGSPYEADIKLEAVYKVKTSLSGLPEIPDQYKGSRVNVDCIVNLSNNLYNPDIRFSINLPDASDDLKRSVFAVIDTSNTLAMNQQMISLLVLNTFSSTSGISTATASLGFSSYEIISAQLSRMLSQISKDFDIGVNYRPGDQISPQELELALSTQLWDNRVTIDGAFGMNSYNTTSQSTTQVIGDVLVEVKITEDGRFRVKAFNRTNSALEVSSGRAPYTQGVGILFRKEFNSFGEIFHRVKKPKTPDKKPAL